jgi:GT2 family glycosyltransferase
MGARIGSSPYIMIANNDLIFRKGWLFELLKTNEPVTSPKCPIDPRQKDVTENSKGHEIIKNFSGWCFMVKRYVWEQINGFDEDFGFWYADNAVIEQFKKEGYSPMLVVNSLVEHLGSQTLKTIPEVERRKITYDQREIFTNKYNLE